MNTAALVGFLIGCCAVVIALVFAAAGLDDTKGGDGRQGPSSTSKSSVGSSLAPPPPPGAATPPMATASETTKYPRVEASTRGQGTRIWTAGELAQHDGSDAGAALLLSILGEVYDVGPGARFYAPKNGYSHMAGCDNSRAFTSADDDEGESPAEEAHVGKKCNSKVLDLKPDGIEEVLHWRDFYRDHKEYRYVGVLDDKYFGADGVPTAASQSLEEVRAVGKQAQELEQAIQKRFMSCNSRHEAAKPYVELWCSDGYHPKGSTPVHFYYTLPKKEERGRCACITKKERKVASKEAADQEKRPQPGKAHFRLVDYTDCEQPGQKCRRPKGAKAPL